MPVTSATASTKLSSDYQAMNAFNRIWSDGPGKSWATKGEGIGSWIKAEFSRLYRVQEFKYMQRNSLSQANRMITLEFSDGSTQSFELVQNNAVLEFSLSTVITTSVKVTVDSVYGTINNGANEIEFLGTPHWAPQAWTDFDLSLSSWVLVTSGHQHGVRGAFGI